MNQNGPRPVGSPDDPYFDPYEDPSYNFAFRTRTYNRQENANRFGDVSGKYNYIDDVGDVHNVEFIAGKNTGFHVKTPFPDSNPRAYYGRLFFRGRGKPIPRGRTSIQRGLDGSYKYLHFIPFFYLDYIILGLFLLVQINVEPKPVTIVVTYVGLTPI